MVVVGAAVVAVVVVAALEVVVVVGTTWLDDEPATVVDRALDGVSRVEPDVVDEDAGLALTVVDEVEAKTVWPASSVRPRVASSDPPVNQKVTARALRIPRRRRAPERSEGDMVNRCYENDHVYEDGTAGSELSQRFLGTSSVVRSLRGRAAPDPCTRDSGRLVRKLSGPGSTGAGGCIERRRRFHVRVLGVNSLGHPTLPDEVGQDTDKNWGEIRGHPPHHVSRQRHAGISAEGGQHTDESSVDSTQPPGVRGMTPTRRATDMASSTSSPLTSLAVIPTDRVQKNTSTSTEP